MLIVYFSAESDPSSFLCYLLLTVLIVTNFVVLHVHLSLRILVNKQELRPFLFFVADASVVK